jgi:predicted HicB family RNase H-like nuclease
MEVEMIHKATPQDMAAPLYVRLNSELKSKIEAAAQAKYMSLSAYVRMIVSEHIENAEKAGRS